MKIRAYADIHMYFDIKEKSRYRIELNKIKEELINSNDLDLLVFSGDLMHKVYNMDDDNVNEIFDFVTDIIKICENKHIVFRCIKGTSSHDAKIVESLHAVYKNNPIARFIYEAEIENLTIRGKEYKVRWLPESYGVSEEYEELKRNIFTEMVDFTFFHGTIDTIAKRWTKGEEKPNVTTLPKSFIWEESVLLTTNKYFSAGGHIHEPITFPSEKIFYINSYTSHNFADGNQEKGYMEFIIPEMSLGFEFEWKRVPNKLAPKYITYRYHKPLNEVDRFEVEDYVKSIIIQKNENDRYRLIFESNNHNHISNMNVTVIKDLIKSIANIKLSVTITDNGDTEDSPEVITHNGFDYSDPNIPLGDKIHKIYEDLYGSIDKSIIDEHIKGYSK